MFFTLSKFFTHCKEMKTGDEFKVSLKTVRVFISLESNSLKQLGDRAHMD